MRKRQENRQEREIHRRTDDKRERDIGEQMMRE